MTTLTKKSTLSNSQIHWELKPSVERKEKKIFSADELIDAYFKGKKDLIDDTTKVLFEKFSKNLALAKKVSEELFESLKKENYNCKYVLLKALNVTNFENLFIIKKSDFISDRFREVYRQSREKKAKINNQTFNLSFSFMPYSEKINENRLLTDGYILKYAEK